MEKYLIGNSVVIGRLICKPSQLTEFSESEFFKQIEISLVKYKIEHYRDIALKKSNLKKGITIGKDYFIIEKSLKE